MINYKVSVVTYYLDCRLLQVHLLNDNTRGATMEAVISRMKTVVQSQALKPARSAQPNGSGTDGGQTPPIRFMAVSATIPNVNDVRTTKCLIIAMNY